MTGRDLTTLQWARLLEERVRLRIVTDDRVAEGRLRSVGRRTVELDYPPRQHEGFPLAIERRSVRRVWAGEGRAWRRVRSRRRSGREEEERAG